MFEQTGHGSARRRAVTFPFARARSSARWWLARLVAPSRTYAARIDGTAADILVSARSAVGAARKASAAGGWCAGEMVLTSDHGMSRWIVEPFDGYPGPPAVTRIEDA